jgi:hypothetical protein
MGCKTIETVTIKVFASHELTARALEIDFLSSSDDLPSFMAQNFVFEIP